MTMRRSTLGMLDDGHLYMFSKANECPERIDAFLRADTAAARTGR